ncbi:ATP-NAD kinase-like domain-containing protein [Auriculariales sp. MPI-PUGE-AT-0066]|nr:ATP-NAD kinase-like domain-containing protein [Auriculariales sp. MPI-PUGE-AT-0066]
MLTMVLNVLVIQPAYPPSCVFSVKPVEIPLSHIIWAEANASSNGIRVSALVRKGTTNGVLTHWDCTVTGDAAAAESWATSLMAAAYKDVQPRRKFRVFVNPVGGQGHGKTIWTKRVKPIFDAAHAQVDITVTERGGHAGELVREMALDYDAILTVSGDGLIHEILNGLANRPDARKALQIPVAPIPTGSGNGFSVSLIGLKEGLDPGMAALNAIKGQPMDIDLCSMTQKDSKVYTFMSQSMGLMADCDLGTENLRWMGNARFMFGFLRGLVSFKSCPIELSICVSSDDKKKMVESHRALRSKHIASSSRSNLLEGDEEAELPPLRYAEGPDENWITFEKPVLYVYAGKVPYVSIDLCQFPIVHPNDGLIDLVIQERSNRGEVVKAIGVAPTGKQYWIESQHYFKVHAYRAKPLGPGFLSVDGEAYPFEEFQVEAHAGLATTLSMLGHYAVDFIG